MNIIFVLIIFYSMFFLRLHLFLMKIYFHNPLNEVLLVVNSLSLMYLYLILSRMIV